MLTHHEEEARDTSSDDTSAAEEVKRKDRSFSHAELPSDEEEQEDAEYDELSNLYWR